jgi:hypothetical protein
MKKKNFFESNLWMWIKLILEIAFIVAVIWIVITVCNDLGLWLSKSKAEEAYDTMYVICTPGDTVNVRPYPNKRGEPEGFLEPGDRVYVDGKTRNGYVHCVEMTNESGSGWVFAGYLVWDEPEELNCTATVVSKGRLAARKYVGGKRTRWLKPMATAKVYYWSDEWAVTNCGYVQSQYLEVDGQ